jgi:hypothetical protein
MNDRTKLTLGIVLWVVSAALMAVAIFRETLWDLGGIPIEFIVFGTVSYAARFLIFDAWRSRRRRAATTTGRMASVRSASR